MFEKVKRVIHSFSSSHSFKKEQQERFAASLIEEQQEWKSEKAKRDRANSQPCENVGSEKNYVHVTKKKQDISQKEATQSQSNCLQCVIN